MAAVNVLTQASNIGANLGLTLFSRIPNAELPGRPIVASDITDEQDNRSFFFRPDRLPGEV